MTKKIMHYLPPDSTGDTSWFFRQNEFERQEIRRQLAFKDRNWPNTEHGESGTDSNQFYPHILPGDLGVFYQGFSVAVYDYFEEADIAIHSEVLNLKSSQAACVNVLFPLKQDLQLAATVLQPFLKDLEEVTNVEFEDTGELDSNPGGITAWLGEPLGGKRGKNRTSIDCAIYWRDRSSNSNITLIEWKYTERGFGKCSAYSKATTETKTRCNQVLNLGGKQACLLVDNGPWRSRHYWDLLKDAGIRIEQLNDLGVCPFSGQLYQVMRQFLVASYLRQNGFDIVDVMVIGFSGNNSLHKIPTPLIPLKKEESDTIIDVWNGMLSDVPPLRYLSVGELFESIDKISSIDQKWREYVKERYGV
jgi:hypothetical protein